MYHVTHETTHYRWSASTKDELLMELDVLVAQHRKRGTHEKIVVQQELSSGERSERLSVVIPSDTAIDDIFADFGVVEQAPRQEKRGFISSFKKAFGRFGRRTTPTEAEEVPVMTRQVSDSQASSRARVGYDKPERSQLPSDYRLVNPQIKSVEKVEKSEISVVNSEERDYVAYTDKTDTFNILDEWVKQEARIEDDWIDDEESEDFVEHVEPEVRVTDRLVENEEHVKPEIVERRPQANVTELPKQPRVEKTVSPVLSVTKPLIKDKVVSTPVASFDESLSTYDLQQEFTQRIVLEIEKIDQQIAQLEAQKSSHQQLLQSIKGINLMQSSPSKNEFTTSSKVAKW